MNTGLSEKQKRVVRSCNARINILTGSVRSGKTLVSNIRYSRELDEGPYGDTMIVGVSRESIQRNVINDLCALLGIRPPATKTNELQLLNKRCYLIGANDESAVRRIQGSTISCALVDEATNIPRPFWNMLLSRLSVPGAKLIATCNPEGPYHWLKTEFLDRADELDLESHHFVLDDNPSLDETYKANLKKEYSGHWYARYILGEWAVAEGLIYDTISEDHFTDEHFPDPAYYIAGIDYGSTNPTCCLLIGIHPQQWPQIRVEKEYYWDSAKETRSKTDAELADDIENFLRGYNLESIFIDPSAKSLRLELQSRDMPMLEADHDVLPGIKTVGKFIAQKNIVIRENCINLKKELHSYSWDSKAAAKGKDVPLKAMDHAADALRYAIFSSFPDGELNNPSNNLSIDEIRRKAYGTADLWERSTVGGYY